MRTAFYIALSGALLFSGFSGIALAQTKQKLEVSAWIPYWREDKGAASAMANIGSLTEINPFGYIVQKDGTLQDAMGVVDEPWKSLIAEAKKRKVRVIPTVMWCDTAAMHDILSNTKKRIALEDEITALVKREGFDGIDIDFECKRAEDKQYFSTFLKGLYQRMGKKWVMCTVESRTPLDSLYPGTPPKGAGEYANDFTALNKYCDRVRLMTYDQQTADKKLLAAADARGEVYGPVSDAAWVEKVMTLAAKTISKKKLVIGVPTYGYEWEVTAYADGFTYDLLWSFNPGYALPLAQALDVTPSRNSAGEMSFSYFPTSTAPAIQASAYAPEGTSSANMAAAGSLAAAAANNSNQSFRYMTWSDAQAVKAKVDLAKRLGIKGVALFKVDGGEDPGIWGVLK